MCICVKCFLWVSQTLTETEFFRVLPTVSCRQQALTESLPSASHSWELGLTSALLDPEVLLGKWAPLCRAGQITCPLFSCCFSSQLQAGDFQAGFLSAESMCKKRYRGELLFSFSQKKNQTFLFFCSSSYEFLIDSLD